MERLNRTGFVTLTLPAPSHRRSPLRTVAAILLLACAAPVAAQAPSDITLTDIKRAIQLAVPSSVALQNAGGGQGAGVIIDTKLDSAQKCWARLLGGSEPGKKRCILGYLAQRIGKGDTP